MAWEKIAELKQSIGVDKEGKKIYRKVGIAMKDSVSGQTTLKIGETTHKHDKNGFEERWVLVDFDYHKYGDSVPSEQQQSAPAQQRDPNAPTGQPRYAHPQAPAPATQQEQNEQADDIPF